MTYALMQLFAWHNAWTLFVVPDSHVENTIERCDHKLGDVRFFAGSWTSDIEHEDDILIQESPQYFRGV